MVRPHEWGVMAKILSIEDNEDNVYHYFGTLERLSRKFNGLAEPMGWS
jgi:hypothetical protein